MKTPPPIPDVRRLTVEAAKARLAGAGFTLGSTAPTPSDQNQGTVVSQDPAPGSLRASGTPVNVIYAVPIPLRPVPDVRRLSIDGAKARLAGARFALGSTAPKESTQDRDTIVSQDPAPGSMRAPDTAVNVTYATPIVRAVPDVRGLTVEAAKARLAAAGFAIDSITSVVVVSTAHSGTVIAQHPVAHTVARQDTPVGIVLAATTIPGPIQWPPAFAGTLLAITASAVAARVRRVRKVRFMRRVRIQPHRPLGTLGIDLNAEELGNPVEILDRDVRLRPVVDAGKQDIERPENLLSTNGGSGHVTDVGHP